MKTRKTQRKLLVNFTKLNIKNVGILKDTINNVERYMTNERICLPHFNSKSKVSCKSYRTTLSPYRKENHLNKKKVDKDG